MFRGVEIWAVRGLSDRAASLFLFVATLLPVFTSVFFAAIAISELGAFCRTSAGIYTASAICLVASIGLVLTTWDTSDPEDDMPPPRPLVSQTAPTERMTRPPKREIREESPLDHPVATWGIGAIELCGFVLALVVLYLLVAPDHSRYVGQCGSLPKPEDTNNVLIPIGSHRGPKQAIEVFDPLCPACRGFEQRLDSSGLGEHLDRRAMLFPLDDKCNWMITSSIHPGACTVSEAILCADRDAGAVIAWAFENQEAIREAAAADPDSAKRMVIAKFPNLSKCVGSARARQRLNQSLRWAVSNQLPVLTPQLYVDGGGGNYQKLCDEDTDLGLDFALSRMIGGN